MLTPAVNSQRGVPFDPHAASIHRTRLAAEKDRQARREAAQISREERRAATLAHARRLDEENYECRERARWGRK